MICKVCGTIINSESKYKITLCSEECRIARIKSIKRAYYDRNKQLVIDRAEEWRIKNPDKAKKCRDNYKFKNPEKVKETKQKYRSKNIDKLREKSRIYNNKPERKEYMYKYRRIPSNLEKEKESSKRYYLRSYHVEKNGHLKRTFGITLEEYNALLEKQNKVCAICREAEVCLNKKINKVKDLAVDHCHTTGKVRGLLCFKCNSTLGKFKDSIELLQSAIDYLKQHKENSNE